MNVGEGFKFGDQAYEQGRIAGLQEAIDLVYALEQDQPEDQRYAIHDLVWVPLYEETERRRRAVWSRITGKTDAADPPP